MELEQIDIKKFKTVQDYATERNISVQAVYKQIRTGKIKSKKIGSYILIDLN